MKNLAIYVHYSALAEIKNYERYFLTFLMRDYEVYFISNSALSDSSQKWLIDNSINYKLRDNVGFDLGAFKEFIESETDWREVDTLLLTNNSFYAPIGDLPKPSELLDNKDFFGWYLHPKTGWIQQHLQSYFLLFGEKLIRSGELQNIFSKFESPRNFDQAIEIETRLTVALNKLGFTFSFTTSFEDMQRLFPNPSMLLPDLLLESGVPLIKRKSLTLAYQYYLENTFGEHPKLALEKAGKLGYPTTYIYEDLLEYPQSQTFPNLPHFFILDKDSSSYKLRDKKIGLILYVYFEDLIEQNKKIIDLFRQIEAKILLVSPITTLLSEYQEIFGEDCEYKTMCNRGRNEYAYFVCGKQILEDCDYTCLLHDKKSQAEQPAIRGFDWNSFCIDNLVPSVAYILNVVNKFEEHPELGLLFPPPPIFSKWRNIHTTVWQNPNNLRWAKVLFKKLNLNVPFDNHPLVPYGAMFWVRKGALSVLTQKDIPDNFFPKEPLPADGSILHALERIYSMIAQSRGYFSGWILNVSSAERYLLNLFELYNSTSLMSGNARESEEQFRAPGIKVSTRMLLRSLRNRLRKEYLKLWKKI